MSLYNLTDDSKEEMAARTSGKILEGIKISNRGI
jgi:hypothetical protein